MFVFAIIFRCSCYSGVKFLMMTIGPVMGLSITVAKLGLHVCV